MHAIQAVPGEIRVRMQHAYRLHPCRSRPRPHVSACAGRTRCRHGLSRGSGAVTIWLSTCLLSGSPCQQRAPARHGCRIQNSTCIACSRAICSIIPGFSSMHAITAQVCTYHGSLVGSSSFMSQIASRCRRSSTHDRHQRWRSGEPAAFLPWSM